MRKQIECLTVLVVIAILTAACGKSGPMSSPTATYKMQHDAWQNGDRETYMKTLSKRALDTYHGTAPKYGGDLIEFSMKMKSYPYTSDTRNEKINGDSATLEAKTTDGDWQALSFVKEGDEWKFVTPTWMH